MIAMHCVLVPVVTVRPVKWNDLQPMDGQRDLLEMIYKGNGVAVRNGMLVI